MDKSQGFTRVCNGCGGEFALVQGVALPDGSFLCDDCHEYSVLSNFVGTGKTIVKTERGWGGHFCCSDKCWFRRNTLVECGDIKIVVSTVGNLRLGDLTEMVGLSGSSKPENERVYETLCFVADRNSVYLDADVSKEIDLSTVAPTGILRKDITDDIDNKANEMHDKIVFEVTRLMTSGKINGYLPHEETKE